MPQNRHTTDYCEKKLPDLVAHVAVGEVEAGEHDGLQLGLLHHVAVHAVTNLAHTYIHSPLKTTFPSLVINTTLTSKYTKTTFAGLMKAISYSKYY